MNRIIALLCCSAYVFGAEITFSLPFDGKDINAVQSKNERTPIKAIPFGEENFIAGFNGKTALRTTGGEALTFSASRNVYIPEGSVSFWFMPEKWLTDKSARFLHIYIPGKNKELAIFYFQKKRTSGDLLFRIVVSAGDKKTDVQTVIPASYIKAGTWQQIVCTWDAGYARIYLNGAKADEKAMPSDFAAIAGFDPGWGSIAILPVIVSDGDDAQVRTAIDDVTVLKGALTEDEVKQRFQSDMPGAPMPVFSGASSAGSFRVSKALEDCVSVDVPAGRNAVVRDTSGAQRITAEECSMTVDADAPVTVRLRSGVFPVSANASYAVNFSDRPPLFTRAGADGVLLIPLSYPTNFCGFTVSKVDDTDLAAGIAWNGSASIVTNPLTGALAPCGSYERDMSMKRAQSPSLKLVKTARDGIVSFESTSVPVTAGKEYLLSGYYHITESAFGSKMRFHVLLKGAGKPDKYVREWNLTHFVVPLYGETWRYSQVRVAVPAGYDTAAVVMSLEGSTQTMWWDEVKLREAPRAHFLIQRPLTAEDTKPRYSLDDVRSMWKDRSPRAVKVEKIGSLPVLTCDGRPVPLLAYNHYRKGPEVIETKAMLGAGISWQFITSERYPKKSFWTGIDTYDLAEIRSNIEAVLQYDPNALIMMNVQLRPMFREWGEANPDSIWREADGSKIAGYKSTLKKLEALPAEQNDANVWYTSYSSDAYRASVVKALKTLTAYLKSFDTGKAVAGIMLWGGNDNQWQRPWEPMYEGFDHSPAALRDYKRFLRGMYQDDDGIAKAWGTGASIDGAVFPTADERNPAQWFLDPRTPADRRIIDANTFGDEGLARSIELFGRTIKESMGRDIIVCTYLHDAMEFGGRSSHQVLFESDAIDCIIGIPSYSAFRTAGSVGQVSGALSSYSLNGKLHLCEFDIRTHTAYIAKDAFTGLAVTFGGALNEREFINFARRDSAMTLARGAGAWYLVMPDQMFNTEGYRSAVAEIARASSNAAVLPMPDDNAQMAVFIDQRIELAVKYSYSRAISAMAVSMPIRTAFNRSGVSFDPYFLSDIDNPARPKYKVHFILTAPTITKKQIAWIQENLQKDGNVLVFCNAAGMSSTAGSFEENIRKLTGMTVRYEPAAVGIFRAVPIPGSDRMADGLKDNCEIMWDMPLFYIDDADAKVFGKIAGTDKAGWAVKRFKDWTSVYIAIAGNITPELIRSIVREAGITPIGPAGDVTTAGNGFISIHALSDGKKKLSLGRRSELIDLADNRSIPPAAELELPMRTGETRWFRRK